MLNFPSLFSLPLEHPSLLISYLTIGISGHPFYAIILLLFIYFMSFFLPFCISSVVSSTPFSWFYDADLDHRICAKQKFWKNKLNNRVTAMIFSTNNFSKICWTRCVLPGHAIWWWVPPATGTFTFIYSTTVSTSTFPWSPINILGPMLNHRKQFKQ